MSSSESTEWTTTPSYTVRTMTSHEVVDEWFEIIRESKEVKANKRAVTHLKKSLEGKR